MPWTVNGIGTWYWGRSKGMVRRGVCDGCGALAAMKSYDTQSFFVIFLVPIIPLGQKRIVDECPHCQRHRVIKLKDWQAGRREVLTELIAEAERNPRDTEKITNALAGCIVFQTPDVIDRLTALVNQHHPQSAELNNLVADAYSYFSRDAEAAPYLERAYELEPTPDRQLELATNALELGQPDRAWELLEEGPSDYPEQRAGRLVAVAESYQSFGMHEAALTVLETALQANPEIASWDEYKRINRTAAKYKNSDKKITPKLLAPLKPLKSDNVAANMVARFAPLMMLLIVVGGYMWTAYAIGTSRDVYFINGLDEPYKIEVADTQRTLNPGVPLILTLAEGSWTVNVVDGVAIEPQEFSMSTDFFQRPFLDPTFVVNPDRTSLVFQEDVGYAEVVAQAAEAQYQVFAGDLVHTYWSVDYPFQEFPDEITLPGGDPVMKRGLSLSKEMPPAAYVYYVIEALGVESAKELFIRRLEFVDDFDFVVAVSTEFTPEEFITATESLRANDPPQVSLHRVYQELRRKLGAGQELQAEYKTRLREQPDSTAYRYLLARVSRDTAERRELLKEVAATDEELAEAAQRALLFDHLCAGEFPSAANIAKQLLKNEQLDDQTLVYISDACEATGEFDVAQQALDRFTKKQQRFVGTPVARQFSILTHQGDTAGADAYYKTVERELGEWLGSVEAGESVARMFSASLYYMRKDLTALEAARPEDDHETPGVMLSMVKGDLAAARQGLIALEEFDTQQALVALMLAAEAEDAESEQLITAALNTLEAAEHQFVQWWRGGKAPNPDQVIHWLMHPQHKRIALVALGQRFPEIRTACFELAHKLNFSLSYPHYFIERITSEASAATAAGG